MLDCSPHNGLTHVIDKGLGPRAWEDVLETSGDYISIIKLGWGTAYVTPNLKRKLEVLKEKPVVIGGTFLEAVIAQDKIDEYKQWITELGLTHVEISDGVIDLERERKLELIADFAADFTVLSEVGSKDAECVFAPYQWVAWIKEEIEAGAAKVITEAREGGTAGIFRGSGEVRSGLIDEIVHEVPVDSLLFEAPQKDQQAWFIRHLGPEVNLGNIPPEEVIPLETLRLGLRSDTMADLLLRDLPAPRA
jgi:phosphosulfolactate synthase